MVGFAVAIAALLNKGKTKMNINEAIQNAKRCMMLTELNGEESPEQAAQLATAYALIAIAETLNELTRTLQRKQRKNDNKTPTKK